MKWYFLKNKGVFFDFFFNNLHPLRPVCTNSNSYSFTPPNDALIFEDIYTPRATRAEIFEAFTPLFSEKTDLLHPKNAIFLFLLHCS